MARIDAGRVPSWLLTMSGWLVGRGAEPATQLLGYHAVGEGGSPLSLPTQRFRQQIEWLLSLGYRFETLSSWWCLASAGRQAPGPCAIVTFDDGYRSVLLHAAPVLASYGIRATLFAVTDYIGSVNGYDEVRAGISQQPLLTWEELRELTRRGWDVQSHGARHLSLTTLPLAQLDHEVRESKARLEQRLGTQVKFFAYPYGLVNRRAAVAVARAGYQGGVTCRSGVLSEGAGADPYRLPRIMCDQLPTFQDFTLRFSPGYQRLLHLRTRMQGRFALSVRPEPDRGWA